MNFDIYLKIRQNRKMINKALSLSWENNFGFCDQTGHTGYTCSYFQNNTLHSDTYNTILEQRTYVRIL